MNKVFHVSYNCSGLGTFFSVFLKIQFSKKNHVMAKESNMARET